MYNFGLLFYSRLHSLIIHCTRKKRIIGVKQLESLAAFVTDEIPQPATSRLSLVEPAKDSNLFTPMIYFVPLSQLQSESYGNFLPVKSAM